MKKSLQKVLALIFVIVSGFFVSQNTANNGNTENLAELFNKKKSGEIITVKAQVLKKLADDNEGDRHQKMIAKVGDLTVLLAHNIDVAPRVPVRKGDTIEIRGQYEWNNKGGIIHWTHRDKNNKHTNGWIKHNNKTYQ